MPEFPLRTSQVQHEWLQNGKFNYLINKVDGQVLWSDAPIQHRDDFIGAAVQSHWTALDGSDAQEAHAISAGVLGGVLSLTSGDTTTVAESISGYALGRNFRADKGGCLFQVRLAMSSAITTRGVFVGFTDTISAEEAFTISGTTLTSTTTDGFGLLYDTAQTTDQWYACGCDSDVDAVHTITGVAPVADTYQTLTVAIDQAGSARFWINNKLYHTMSAACSPDVLITPVFYIMARTTASAIALVDYANAFGGRLT